MAIIDLLREHLEQAIRDFDSHHRPLSLQRENDIEHIRAILRRSNPLKVRSQLILYLDNLSSGWEALWPFFEVNRFKSALKTVLELPHFQENWILKSMIVEAGIRLSQDNLVQVPSDRTILQRLEKLETMLSDQTQRIVDLQQEVKRLTTENTFLTKTIAMLSDKNKALLEANKHIQAEKATMEDEVKELRQQYDTLRAENRALKKDAQTLTQACFSKSNSGVGSSQPAPTPTLETNTAPPSNCRTRAVLSFGSFLQGAHSTAKSVVNERVGSIKLSQP